MAEFEGEKNLNRETSELEVKGKFKLSEEELENVAGGCGEKTRGYAPGEKCPHCPGTVVNTNEPLSDGYRHTSVCQLCGKKYYWWYADEEPAN